MKAAFDWEDNFGFRRCSWSAAEFVRMSLVPDQREAGIMLCPNGKQWCVVIATHAMTELCADFRFNSIEEAKRYVDGALEKAGYKTIPFEYKALL